MNECEEIDLSREVNVISMDNEFNDKLSEYRKQFYNAEPEDISQSIGVGAYKKYVIESLAHVTKRANLVLTDERADDLNFKCLNLYGDKLMIYLLDDPRRDDKYIIVLKNKDENYIYKLQLLRNKLFLFGNGNQFNN